MREQLTRLARLPDVPVTVEALPGGLLGWRTRVRYAIDPAGRTALRRHRSHELEPVGHCPLGTDAVGGGRPATGTGRPAPRSRWSAPGRPWCWPRPPTRTRGRRPAAAVLEGPPRVRERAAGRDWELAATGFWQVHPAAADVLAGCVLDFLAPAPGEAALDLYAGAGLFAGAARRPRSARPAAWSPSRRTRRPPPTPAPTSPRRRAGGGPGAAVDGATTAPGRSAG